MESKVTGDYQKGQRGAIRSVALNACLAFVKVLSGVLGNSYALIADGIESSLDIISSAVLWSGLRIAATPPDQDHPWGHGKAEPLAGLVVSFFLLGGAVIIGHQSILEIITPHHAPAPFTLAVLVGVVFVKEVLFRNLAKLSVDIASKAVEADAWHQRSDAITSAAAFVGISIALVMGPGYEAADDWAALLACAVIIYNGVRIAKSSIREVMDAAVPDEFRHKVGEIALSTPGITSLGRCLIRKSGLEYFVELDAEVDGAITVRQGHDIATALEKRLLEADLAIRHVSVHIEPAGG
jgi:cation diffusion facilitator family transporter